LLSGSGVRLGPAESLIRAPEGSTLAREESIREVRVAGRVV
jgi:hypothetical protein